MTRVLVLGGTGWLSGYIARLARDAGADVTCAARGLTRDAPEGARLVRIDRTAEQAYAPLVGTDWDAVVDVSSQPSHVDAAVRALGERAAHWTFVSSGSVYARTDVVDADETAEVHVPLVGDMASMEEYGPAKVACENHVTRGLGDRALIVRAGLIGGPGDPSDRYGYWVSRFALAGAQDVLVPDAPDLSTQTIDVRDLAAWITGAPGAGVRGTINAVGRATGLGAVLAAAADVAGFTGRMVPADPDWLTEEGVEPWAGPRSLPLWLPVPEYAGFGARSDTRSQQAGLHRRPLADTLADVLTDERARGLDRDRQAGLTRAQELELLAGLRDD